MNKKFYEILKMEEERIRGLYGTYYKNYMCADSKSERKFKLDCKKKCDEFIAQIRMIELLKVKFNEIK
jgi:hypothetical protein